MFHHDCHSLQCLRLIIAINVFLAFIKNVLQMRLVLNVLWIDKIGASRGEGVQQSTGYSFIALPLPPFSSLPYLFPFPSHMVPCRPFPPPFRGKGVWGAL